MRETATNWETKFIHQTDACKKLKIQNEELTKEQSKNAETENELSQLKKLKKTLLQRNTMQEKSIQSLTDKLSSEKTARQQEELKHQSTEQKFKEKEAHIQTLETRVVLLEAKLTQYQLFTESIKTAFGQLQQNNTTSQ